MFGSWKGSSFEPGSMSIDLPEAEAELVSGYNVEFSAMGFALFFLGEYANMLILSALTTICALPQEVCGVLFNTPE
jgi:NADH:ubiquinone oxidoreductase subunit H